MHLIKKIAFVLSLALFSNLATASDLPQSGLPNDMVVLGFADKDLRTQYSIICPEGVECFFSPYAEGRFKPIGYAQVFGQNVPAIFLPNHLYSYFEPLYLGLTGQISPNDLSEVSQNYVEYFGYGEYFYQPPNFGETVTFEVNGVTFTFVEIPAGIFMFGEGDNQREVEVAPFMMMQHQVTQAQWAAIMGNNPSLFKGDDRPVERVSYDDVQEFITRLNALLAEQGLPEELRLPTEEEWEYAARAGSQTRYPWGDGEDGLTAFAWGAHNNSGQSHNVMELDQNAWGLYDMIGNVLEWVDSPLSEGSQARVSRGGSWLDGPENLRSAVRFMNTAVCDFNLGFRLLRTFTL